MRSAACASLRDAAGFYPESSTTGRDFPRTQEIGSRGERLDAKGLRPRGVRVSCDLAAHPGRTIEAGRGLAIEITPPDTQVANDLLENIRLGNVDQMSFAFAAVEEKWIEKKDEIALRELIDVDLYDVSVVTYPAYEGTSVGLRSAESIFNDHLQSLEGQAPEGDDDPKPAGLEPADAREVADLIT